MCVAEVLFCVWPVHVEALGTARRRHEPSRNARCCLLSGRAFQLLRDFVTCLGFVSFELVDRFVRHFQNNGGMYGFVSDFGQGVLDTIPKRMVVC